MCLSVCKHLFSQPVSENPFKVDVLPHDYLQGGCIAATTIFKVDVLPQRLSSRWMYCRTTICATVDAHTLGVRRTRSIFACIRRTYEHCEVLGSVPAVIENVNLHKHAVHAKFIYEMVSFIRDTSASSVTRQLLSML